jgi:hypothetical protein
VVVLTKLGQNKGPCNVGRPNGFKGLEVLYSSHKEPHANIQEVNGDVPSLVVPCMYGQYSTRANWHTLVQH